MRDGVCREFLAHPHSPSMLSATKNLRCFAKRRRSRAQGDGSTLTTTAGPARFRQTRTAPPCPLPPPLSPAAPDGIIRWKRAPARPTAIVTPYAERFSAPTTGPWRDVLRSTKDQSRDDLEEICAGVDWIVGLLRFRVGAIAAGHLRRSLLDLVVSRSRAELGELSGRGLVLSRGFAVPEKSPLSAAEMFVTADNLFTLYVNGKLVGQSYANPNLWHRPKRFDVSKVPRCRDET